MTTLLHAHLQLTTVDAEDRLRIEIEGDLDFGTADFLLETVSTQLAARPELNHLHLHCAGLGMADSMGLSSLLMIRRRTSAAGVQLHLDDRPESLDRVLEITGTFEHLTGASPTASTESSTIDGA
ncbi:STAS domain-containing protein [Streptomyces griseofuscus]|uniref:STAS domain-containing protein n=1 Tax=Streptomyces griseofuscus TaxID=146922 RepID=UPI00382AED79